MDFDRFAKKQYKKLFAQQVVSQLPGEQKIQQPVGQMQEI
jgi:hypothetical protein